jgi:succinoglycan biosynthesis transport protein ExoP
MIAQDTQGQMTVPALHRVRARPFEPPGPDGEREPSAFGVLNNRIHGRWKWAFVLSVILGALFAVVGYKVASIQYTSTGMIHFSPSGQYIIQPTQETGAVPRYEAKIEMQALRIKEPRVIELALNIASADLASTPLAGVPNAAELIEANLSVEAEPQMEIIQVSYEADSPRIAQIIVKAILDAYFELHGDSERKRGRETRVSVIEDLRSQKEAELSASREELQRVKKESEYGSIDYLSTLMQLRANRIEKLEMDLESVRLAHGDGADLERGAHEGDPTIVELDIFAPGLLEKHRLRAAWNTDLEMLRGYYLPGSHQVKESERQLEALDQDIRTMEEAALELWKKAPPEVRILGNRTRGLDATGPVRSAEQIAALIDKHKQRYDELDQEYQELQRLRQECSDLEKEVEGLDKMLEMLRIEDKAVAGGTISPFREASLPFSPSTDRRKLNVVMGLGGGVALGFGFVFLIGTIDRRAFGFRQLHRNDGSYDCIGVLPDLRRAQRDSLAGELAVQCIHQIRNRIEAERDPNRDLMLAITSPYQGDGKTSLAIALGWSYAAAGHRTLLLDCDFIGQGLSRDLEVLDHPGLKEFIRDRVMDDHIVSLRTPNLDVLPIGLDPTVGPEAIRRDDFESLCDQLRRQYDVIIADIGPAVGSIELVPVASAADGVILSFRRGQSQSGLDECLRSLSWVSTKFVGVVMNYADRSDCRRYTSGSIIGSRMTSRAHDRAQSEIVDVEAFQTSNLMIKAIARSPVAADQTERAES